MKTLRRIGRDWRKPTKNVSRPPVKFAFSAIVSDIFSPEN